MQGLAGEASQTAEVKAAVAAETETDQTMGFLGKVPEKAKEKRWRLSVRSVESGPAIAP